MHVQPIDKLYVAKLREYLTRLDYLSGCTVRGTQVCSNWDSASIAWHIKARQELEMLKQILQLSDDEDNEIRAQIKLEVKTRT